MNPTIHRPVMGKIGGTDLCSLALQWQLVKKENSEIKPVKPRLNN